MKMKAMKMKPMKMKPMKRVSKIAKGKMRKVMVLKGKKVKTTGGLTAAMLTKNKHGKAVSKKQSLRGKKNPWIAAVNKARAALKITGFKAVKKGTLLYAKAKSFYR